MLTLYVFQIKVKANDSGIINVLENSITIFVQLLDIDDQEPEFPRRPDTEPYILGPVPEEHSMEYCGTVDIAVDRDSHVNNSLIFYYIIGNKPSGSGYCQPRSLDEYSL